MKTFLILDEDDEGYRSASPSSQNMQSQACVILWMVDERGLFCTNVDKMSVSMYFKYLAVDR